MAVIDLVEQSIQAHDRSLDLLVQFVVLEQLAHRAFARVDIGQHLPHVGDRLARVIVERWIFYQLSQRALPLINLVQQVVYSDHRAAHIVIELFIVQQFADGPLIGVERRDQLLAFVGDGQKFSIEGLIHQQLADRAFADLDGIEDAAQFSQNLFQGGERRITLLEHVFERGGALTPDLRAWLDRFRAAALSDVDVFGAQQRSGGKLRLRIHWN